MAGQVCSACETSATVAASVIVCDFVDVGDHEGVTVIDANEHDWSSKLVIWRGCMGQYEITSFRDLVGCDAYLEVFFDPIQLVHRDWPRVKLWASCRVKRALLSGLAPANTAMQRKRQRESS